MHKNQAILVHVSHPSHGYVRVKGPGEIYMYTFLVKVHVFIKYFEPVVLLLSLSINITNRRP